MVPRSALVGRDFELGELQRLFADNRCVVITGPAGCGKSRLAAELEAGFWPQEDGETRQANASSCTVLQRPGMSSRLSTNVRGVATIEHLISSLLVGLGERERGGISSRELLACALADRPGPTLLVLDDCEHLAAQATDLVDELLAAADQLRVVATSRIPLAVRGAIISRLGPMSIPDGSDVASVVRSEAGRLFVDRAVASAPDFALTPSSAESVARICTALDGLPHALVVVASRVSDVDVGDIAEILSSRIPTAAEPLKSRVTQPAGNPGREPPESRLAPEQGSIRMSLDWSYGLLSGRERLMFRRLSVFAGGWTAQAARQIAMPDASVEEVRLLLAVLESTGLIQPIDGTEERWTLLRTIGDFAAELAEVEGDAVDVRRLHSAWFGRVPAEADTRLGEPSTAAMLEEEAPNIRLALEAAFVSDPDRAASIVAALTRHWILSERFEEARSACARVLATSGGSAEALAVIHSGASVIEMLREDYSDAVAHAQAALALVDDVDEPEILARCMQLFGMVLILTGLDLDQGLRCTREAVELMRETTDQLGLAWSLVNLAMAGGICDRFDLVRSSYEEFISMPGLSDHARLRTWAEQAKAWSDLIAGSPTAALQHAELSLELEGDRPSMTYFQGICHRIHALGRIGRSGEAVRVAKSAMLRAHESGAFHAVPGIDLGLAVAEFMWGHFEDARVIAERLVDSMPQTHTLVLMREILVCVALASGDSTQAASHAQALVEIAEHTRSPRHRSVADLASGRVAIAQGSTERGKDLLHSALTIAFESSLERIAADVLDELGSVASCAGDTPRAARLFGAASSVRGRIGAAAPEYAVDQLETARSGLADQIAHEAWIQAGKEGQALMLVEVMSYANRSRGVRDRPTTGWESLTPTELEVIRLAANGISNPEIASKLFMSRSTVKMHLSKIYLKLSVANRIELAAAAASTLGPWTKGSVDEGNEKNEESRC